MRAAIIGAGVSGLAAARALLAVGIDVAIYEASVEVGGVWSAGRRYPGISLQSDKHSYSFSNRPMPEHYPDYPDGALVQAYLTEYAEAEGIAPHIRFRTRVAEAEYSAADGWRLQLETPSGPDTDRADWLIVANGITSWPNRPDLPGGDEFEAAGGRLLSPSELGDGDELVDRRVVVLGWGKSAADVAVASAAVARSVDLVTRRIAWKLPRRTGAVTFQHLLITRLGEHVLWAPYRSLPARVLRRIGAPLRMRLVAILERRISRQLNLDALGLVPAESLTGVTHLTTPGFFEALARGDVTLHRDTTISRLGSQDGHPMAHLAGGSMLEADVIVTATGYDQDVSFFGPSARAALLDEQGDLVLDRHTIPPYLDRIAFVGWMNSFRSPIGAEIQSIWIAARILGVTRRIRRRQPPARVYRLTHRSAGERGLPLVSSGSGFLDLDEWIEEAGLRIPRRVRFHELVRPLDPTDYRDLLDQLRRRIADANVPGPREATASVMAEAPDRPEDRPQELRG